MGQQRGCVTDKGRMSVEIALVIVAAIAVVFVVTETRTDDVGSDGVGKFRCHRPIVFFHWLLCLLVFAAQQPIVGLWCRAD